MDFHEIKNRSTHLVKKYIQKKVAKAILLLLKKLALKLVALIMKAFLAAMTALVTVLGLPVVIVLAILIIIGGAMFMLAPSLGLIDDDSPISQQELRTELQSLIVNSSSVPNYRPPFELVSSIDMMRIIQEDKNPWEVNFKPIVTTLAPDLTYQDYLDTYEIKTVTTETYEVTHYETVIETYIEIETYQKLELVPYTVIDWIPVYGWIERLDCDNDYCWIKREWGIIRHDRVERKEYREEIVTKTREVKKQREVIVPVTETVTEVDTKIKEEKQTVTFLKTAHAWNRYETFYYKENELNNSFELIDTKVEGNKKVETFKRKTKEWVFDGKDFIHDYTKFDQSLTDLDLEESAVRLLVEALKENNIPLDGYTGSYFDIFISGGMRMMIPQEYLAVYRAAEKVYDVGWNYLAAIHYVETKFSTVKMVSSVGAIGPMQFMPCTFVGWAHPTCGGLGKGNISDAELIDPAVIAKYGGYGVDANNDGKSDPWDLEDSVFSAANLLNDNGFSTDKRRAIRSYNHSDRYVADVLHYAELFKSTQGAIPPVSSGTFTRPAIGPITSDYGPRWGSFHHGVDIGRGAEVVPIVAAADGTVSRSYYSSSYGETIFIEHIINGERWETVYAHMASGSRRVQVGEKVQKGQIIGIMGTTGRSTGIHLHFEIHTDGGWNINKSNSISPTKSGLIEW